MSEAKSTSFSCDSKDNGMVCKIVAQARKLSQKSLYHLVPIIPGTAYGRMIHRHHFHLLAITQKISTRSNRITIHYNVVAILPAYIRKIVQTSAMRAWSQIAECSLSYTKIVQWGGECKSIHNHSQSSRIPFTIFHGPQRGGGSFPPLSNSIDPNKTIGILRA